MARDTWQAARDKSQAASFDYFKEPLRIISGDLNRPISGVLDTAVDDLESESQFGPDGTYPVRAVLSVMRDDLGYIPERHEEMRIRRENDVEREQIYLVVNVDTTTDLLDIELQAQANNGRPYFS